MARRGHQQPGKVFFLNIELFQGVPTTRWCLLLLSHPLLLLAVCMQQYLTARRLIGVAVSAKSNGIWKSIQNSSRCPRQDLGSGRVVSIPVYVSCAERERQGCTDTLAAGGRSTCATLCLWWAIKGSAGCLLKRGLVLWNASLRSWNRFPLIWKGFASCSPIPSPWSTGRRLCSPGHLAGWQPLWRSKPLSRVVPLNLSVLCPGLLYYIQAGRGVL